MSTISSIALSGMTAAMNSLQATAQNIANLNVPGAQQQGVSQSTQAQGGTTANIVTTTNTNANVATDLVQQFQAKNSFLANLSVFQTSNEVMGTLLNTVA
jgi:flagellar basal body rod protein FlgC